jgi:hypothetical protein
VKELLYYLILNENIYSIENMYSRLMHILNEFDEVGESLSNSKIVGKIFRIMIRRSR